MSVPVVNHVLTRYTLGGEEVGRRGGRGVVELRSCGVEELRS
jgi:hypothetical protein